jgi:(1->4)-alpha-D-glucan 1-alpha-D-glucosylmutase
LRATGQRRGRAHQSQPHLLHQLLEKQHYRVAYWRPANDEINYRRFFGINELVAIHAEDPEVFMRSHELVRRLAAEDIVHGLRIDHVDGLLDPLGYLRQLRSELESVSPAQPWLVVEKVLDRSERLGPHWPVDGTTGYDALDALNRVFVSGAAYVFSAASSSVSSTNRFHSATKPIAASG